MRTLTKTFTKTPAVPAQQALEGFKILVDASKEYGIVREHHQTERSRIQANKEVELARLHHQAELLESYLKQSFKQQNETIDKMFERLDKGIEENNPQLIALAMQNIENIVKSSPLKEALQIVSDISDPNVKSIQF